jgi:hypothetical protein
MLTPFLIVDILKQRTNDPDIKKYAIETMRAAVLSLFAICKLIHLYNIILYIGNF